MVFEQRSNTIRAVPLQGLRKKGLEVEKPAKRLLE